MATVAARRTSVLVIVSPFTGLEGFIEAGSCTHSRGYGGRTQESRTSLLYTIMDRACGGRKMTGFSRYGPCLLRDTLTGCQWLFTVLFSRLVLIAVIAVACAACGSSSPSKAESGSPITRAGRKEFVFKGKVDAVDPVARTLTVTNENVEGWMAPMTMVYKADKEDVYAKVKPGDQITARVYDGIEDMLYDVQVIPSGGGASK
jgi:Cu/Ag efflux protein CusF